MENYFGMDSFNRSGLVYGDVGSCGPMGVTSTCIDMDKGTISCFNSIDDKINELKEICSRIDTVTDVLPIFINKGNIIVARLHRGNLNLVFKKN